MINGVARGGGRRPAAFRVRSSFARSSHLRLRSAQRVSEASSSPPLRRSTLTSAHSINQFSAFLSPPPRLAPTDEDESSTCACAVSMQKPSVVIPSSLSSVLRPRRRLVMPGSQSVALACRAFG